jgi:hypothetical protein
MRIEKSHYNDKEKFQREVFAFYALNGKAALAWYIFVTWNMMEDK